MEGLGVGGGGGGVNSRLLRLIMRGIPLKTSHKADFNATNHTVRHSAGFAFSVEPFQQQNIWLGLIDLSPSAAAHLQEFLQSSCKKQMSFPEKTGYSLLPFSLH